MTPNQAAPDQVDGPRRLNLRLMGWTIATAVLILLVILFFADAYRRNAVRLPEDHPTLAELLAPTIYESLVGVDLGDGEAENSEVLITEAPDIDVIRAGLRRETEAVDADPPPPNAFLVCDFDKDGATVREWTCPAGAWVSDPFDPTIKFLEAYDPINRYGEKGYCLKLWYDIDSPNPAYGGLWIQFRNAQAQQTLDLSQYHTLSMMLKISSGQLGGTTRIKIEIKNQNEIGSTKIFGISPRWQRFDIPLAAFDRITDWSQVKEMTIVLDAETVDRKEGLLYIDDVMFVK